MTRFPGNLVNGSGSSGSARHVADAECFIRDPQRPAAIPNGKIVTCENGAGDLGYRARVDLFQFKPQRGNQFLLELAGEDRVVAGPKFEFSTDVSVTCIGRQAGRDEEARFEGQKDDRRSVQADVLRIDRLPIRPPRKILPIR